MRRVSGREERTEGRGRAGVVGLEPGGGGGARWPRLGLLLAQLFLVERIKQGEFRVEIGREILGLHRGKGGRV